MKSSLFYMKRFIAIIAAVTIFLNALPVLADPADTDTSAVGSAPSSVVANDYRTVRAGLTGNPYKGDRITVEAVKAISLKSNAEIKTAEGKKAAVITEGGTVDFRITLPEEGLYTLLIEYCDLSGSTLPADCGVRIDGVYPYFEMRSQRFAGRWRYEGDGFSSDRYGNEVVPESVRETVWQEAYFSDASALTMAPFEFLLTAGEHTVTFNCVQGAIAISNITAGGLPAENFGTYGKAEGNAITVLEGESPTYKNSATVRPAGEYDATLTPYSYSALKMNLLSGASFADGGQSVSWEFTVEKDGFYQIGFKFRQNSKNDFPVFRYLYLDGRLYGEEFRNLPFHYARSVNTMCATDKNGEPLGVYLEAGSTHTLTLAVSLEPLADAIGEVRALIGEINAMSLKLMKITGNSTSKYRDFDIAAYIPDIEESLLLWADRANKLYNSLSALNPEVKTVGEFSTLLICVEQLKSLAADINGIPYRINELYQGDSSVNQYLANTLESLYSSPLAIDQIYIYQADAPLPKTPGFFYKIAMSFCRFLNSFVSDYYSAREESDEDHLRVWINRSRLYIELMQKMADDTFFTESGIPVDFSLMPNEEKLVLATASGSAPDAALGVTYTIPFELAVRGALCRLSDFPDWEEISSRFGQGIVNIGAMDGGYYLLPETSDFLVLFYRKDILDELGLSVPDTMEDVKSMIPTLKRYGMDFYSHIAGHSGTKTLSVLVPFIYQMGGSVYGSTATQLEISSDPTVAAFQEMSDLFTVYDIPYEISNFYQHFRSGSIPIGISGFNTYMTLINSAPEIESSWSLAPYPGYKDENGEVQRWISGAQSTAIIFSQGRTDDAWEFLKWWTRTDIQSGFADTLQLTYGNEYMWNTANLEAFERLPWNAEHKTAILEMLNWIVEVPRVPGNYMTQRSLSNALNNIVLSGSGVRRELNEVEKDIRAEVNSKLEEFGYIKDGKTIKEFTVVQ